MVTGFTRLADPEFGLGVVLGFALIPSEQQLIHFSPFCELKYLLHELINLSRFVFLLQILPLPFSYCDQTTQKMEIVVDQLLKCLELLLLLYIS